MYHASTSDKDQTLYLYFQMSPYKWLNVKQAYKKPPS